MVGAVVCELVSLGLIGSGTAFPYGLVLGLAVAVVGMRLLAATACAAANARRSAGAVLGYLVRILLYALALYLCARTGAVAFAGCTSGLLLPKAALVFSQLVMPKIRGALGKEEPEAEYFVAVTDPGSRLFVKSQGMVKYQSGRAFLTYPHFKLYKLVQEKSDGNAKEAGSTQMKL